MASECQLELVSAICAGKRGFAGRLYCAIVSGQINIKTLCICVEKKDIKRDERLIILTERNDAIRVLLLTLRVKVKRQATFSKVSCGKQTFGNSHANKPTTTDTGVSQREINESGTGSICNDNCFPSSASCLIKVARLVNSARPNQVPH